MLKGYQRLSNLIVGFVNNNARADRLSREALAPRKLRSALIETARYCAQTGLVTGSLGEISLRLTGDMVLCNSGSTLFSQIEENDLITVSITKDHLIQSSPPPRHLDYHRQIYSNSSAKAVLYCQPVSVMAVLVRGTNLQPEWIEDGIRVTSTIQTINNDANFPPSIKSGKALMIKNRGLLTWGDDLRQVVDQAEIIERWCQIALAVSQ